MFPENDNQFEETTVKSVSALTEGYQLNREDGWSFFVDKGTPIVPEPGMTARFYGKGIGYQVRGLFLGGVKVFYRTEAEDQEYREIETYGKDAADWLARWDAGKTVWSISMGGLGPGYEQAIQVCAAETLRHLLEVGYDKAAWEGEDEAAASAWDRDMKAINTWSFKEGGPIQKIGPSGAMWGGAKQLALFLYRFGPRWIMTNDQVKDRHIQVSKTFPQL